ncbi:MAG: hypothetical protein RLZZ436_2087, partial [Planctomycetota bacterium]
LSTLYSLAQRGGSSRLGFRIVVRPLPAALASRCRALYPRAAALRLMRGGSSRLGFRIVVRTAFRGVSVAFAGHFTRGLPPCGSCFSPVFHNIAQHFTAIGHWPRVPIAANLLVAAVEHGGLAAPIFGFSPELPALTALRKMPSDCGILPRFHCIRSGHRTPGFTPLTKHLTVCADSLRAGKRDGQGGTSRGSPSQRNGAHHEIAD